MTRMLTLDICEAAGALQACSGIESGIEAALHAMAHKFAEPNTHGLSLVEASNAFNSLHRESTLDTVAQECSAFHQYLSNTYQTPKRQHISGSAGGQYTLSEEGCAQRDNSAMAYYSIAKSPIIDNLKENSTASQVWHADNERLCHC